MEGRELCRSSQVVVLLAVAVVVVVAPLSSEAAMLWLEVVVVVAHLSSALVVWLAVVEAMVLPLQWSLAPIPVLALTWRLARSSKGFAWLAMPSAALQWGPRFVEATITDEI